MSGYSVVIKAKLPVASNDPQAMADASKLLTSELGRLLDTAGFKNITIEPVYRPQLKLDAAF